MKTIIGILLGILGIFFLGVVVVMFLGIVLLAPLKIKYRREIRQKNLEELKKEVFRFEEQYFSYLGNGQKTVKEFKNLIQAQDVSGIKRNWKRLRTDFRVLERRAGHEGRPLIMDYYCWYEIAVNGLIKRTIK